MRAYQSARLPPGGPGWPRSGWLRSTRPCSPRANAKDRGYSGNAVWFTCYKADRRVACSSTSTCGMSTSGRPGLHQDVRLLPLPGRRLAHGHEWARRQAAQAGIGCTELSNGPPARTPRGAGDLRPIRPGHHRISTYREGVDIEPDARSLGKHLGLPHMSDYPRQAKSCRVNPRVCERAPAHNPTIVELRVNTLDVPRSRQPLGAPVACQRGAGEGKQSEHVRR